MALNIEPRNEEVCEKFRTRVIDLEKNAAHLELYKAYSYFIDVLEWVEGIQPFTAIRHNHDADVFADAVLLRNLSRDPETSFEIVSERVDTLLMCSFHAKNPLRFDVARTLASPEQIKEWRRGLLMIFEEIEDHDDPEGSPFTLNLLTLQDA